MILINPDCYQGYRFPSIGLLYLSSTLMKAGLSVEYIDPNYDPAWMEKLEKAIPQHDWIGITANILSIKPALELSQMIRSRFPGKKIVMGGPYPSIKYEELVPAHADAVAVGEAEQTCLELASGKPLSQIAGLAYWEDGAFKFNGRRPIAENIDLIPPPAWELGNPQLYRLEHTKGNPVMPVISSRGCPYNCIFCASDVIFENRIRYRDIDLVLDEIDINIRKHGAKEVHLWDDNFTLKRSRVMEFCEKLQKKNYRGISFMIPSGIKPDIGDYEMFREMKKAGFYAICIAVESGDQEIMNKLGKKVRVEKVHGVIAAARTAGILMNGFFMLGLPFDTEESMRRNIDHACSLPLHQAMFFVTIPFPGTELYDIVEKEGKFLFHDEMKLYEEGYFLGRASCEMPGFNAETLERMFRLANRKFYFRPRVLLALFFKRMHSPAHIIYLVRKWFRVLFRGRQF